ncbi:MAG: hypothetical protein U1E65_25215 [Myxococcota bacterium]
MRRPSKYFFAFQLIVAGVGCGSTTTPMTTCGPNDFNCAKEGEACAFSINCPAGNICNKTDDDLYDMSKTANTCVKVVCATDAECTAPKKCSLEKICAPPICQRNDECPGGNVCSGGACTPAPNASVVTECTVVTPSGAIREGAKIALSAIAKNGSGVVQPGIEFIWTSSDPTKVTIDMETNALGANMTGPSTLTAKVKGKETVVCGRSVTLNNFAMVPAGSTRVVLVTDGEGTAIAGADVTMIPTGGGAAVTQQTGADGSTVFASANADSITVVKAGWQYVSVLSPGSVHDLFIPVPRDPDALKAGGFRGAIDISKTKRGDVQLGLAGPSLPSNLLDFDISSLIGDSIATTINAPQLGLNNQNTNLPGGLVFALGTQKFTVDYAAGPPAVPGLRCQGYNPAEGELGCFAARAPAGPGVAWALAGRLKLSDVSSIAGTLSNAFGGSGNDLPIGDILSAVLPLLRTLNHAVNAGLLTTEYAKVPTPPKSGMQPADCSLPENAGDSDKCMGDFSKYAQVNLAADTALSINSAVTIPTLPKNPDNTFLTGAVLLSVALTEGRGLVPLGLSAGLDTADKMQTPDGKIAGAKHPFGANSTALTDGQVPLTMSPPHGGIEGSKIALVAVALDTNSIGGNNGTSLSGLVNYVQRVDATMTFGTQAFMKPVAGTVDVAAGSFTPTGDALSAATVTRVELQKGDKTWLIYAPGGTTAITFPAVAAARTDIVGAGMGAFIQAVRSPASYGDMFTFGSGKNLDRIIEQIDAFAIQQCKANATAPCKIQ